MVKIRKNGSSKITIVSNQIVRDDSLSWKARGIFVYLWSQSENWNFYEKEVAKHSADGLASLRSGIKELENHGYINRTRERVNGKLATPVWILSEEPKCEKPILENQTFEFQTFENRTLSNTNRKKHQLEETSTKRDIGSASTEQPDYKKEFETLWEHYPKGKKQGKQLALRSYTRWRKSHKDNTFDKAKLQLKKYLNYIKIQQVQTQYIKAAKTWFANIDDEYDQSSKPAQVNYSQYNKRVEKGTDWSKKKPKVDNSVNADKLTDFFKDFENKNGLR